MVYLVLIVSSVIISSLSAVSLCTPENSAIQKLSIIIIIIIIIHAVELIPARSNLHQPDN